MSGRNVDGSQDITGERVIERRNLLLTHAKRIGAAIARSLAEDGADIAISYVSSPDKAKALVRELQEKGVRAVAFQADQSKPSEVTQLVNKVAEHFGHLDN